jgi:hypothetical protein
VDEDGRRGCGQRGDSPASFANALPIVPCFFLRGFFWFRDGGGEGDETGRDGKSVIRCLRHSRRWIDRLRCGVSLSFVCTLELAHSRSRDIPVAIGSVLWREERGAGVVSGKVVRRRKWSAVAIYDKRIRKDQVRSSEPIFLPAVFSFVEECV